MTSILFWGCLSGIFSAGGNILLIASMRVLPVGSCSTIYRLNLVPVILGAFLAISQIRIILFPNGKKTKYGCG